MIFNQQQMRRSGFLIPCLAILFTACNEGIMTESPADASQAGKVTFSLSADLRNDVAEVKSSAEDISVDEFWVEIFNSSKTRIFCEKYIDAKDTTLYVNAGDYTLLATYGTENGVGFGKPFYKAEEPFTVGPQETKPLEAVAKLANVKVAVNFDDNLDNKLSYDQYWAVVRNNGKKLRFNPGENRSGYIPAGSIEFVLVVKINGQYKQYVHPAAEYAPNDFVTFNVSAPLQDGSITIKVMIDDTVEVVEQEEIVIPIEEMLPIEEPTIFSEGFDSENSLAFIEGHAEKKNEVWISATADGILSSATLTIDCESLGLPESVSLADADPSVVAAFEAKGIWWKFNGDMTSVAVNLTDAYNDHITKLEYLGYDYDAARCIPVATIGLSVEVQNGAVKSASESFTICADPYVATGSFSWNDYDVWAWKIVNPMLTLGEGRYDRTKIQYSLDGQSWTDYQDVTSAQYPMGTIEGLEPSTTYHLRAIYGGSVEVAAPVSFTTEAAQQVGNAGFEDWTTLTYAFEEQTGIFSTTTVYQDWWRPYGSDQWWDVNSKKSMPSLITALTVNEIKCYPIAAYSTDAYNGSKSAMIYTIDVGNANTNFSAVGNRYAGEIFIGSADDAGNHSLEGHDFDSRPSSLRFYYKYSPRNNETFYVYIDLKDEQGNIIASAESTGSASDSWKEYSLPLQYSATNAKASSVYIMFKASTAENINIEGSSRVTLNVAGSDVKAHFGSTLRIDDVELVY